MPVRNTDEEQGRVVARAAVAAARQVLGTRLRSAHVIGSLAHGGFVAAVSDVDVALILAPADREDVDVRLKEIYRRVRVSEESVLAERLSVFWTTLDTIRSGQPMGRLPTIDWLDLADCGVLAYGVPLPADLPRPTKRQLVEESAVFAVQKWRHDPGWRHSLGNPGLLVADGRRAASKAVLFPVRFLYTLETGCAGGSNDAVTWYLDTERPHKELIAAAHTWRTRGFADHTFAAQLLAEQLISLYEEFELSYRQQLLADGLDELAGELATTIALLSKP